MDKQDLINCFNGTQVMANSKDLADSTAKAVANSKVYLENLENADEEKRNFEMRQNYAREWAKEMVCVLPGVAQIVVEENTTFASAKEHLHSGKVAVLNFANPEYPGGGVVNGAVAQEECLCRSSNLYSCLSSEQVFEDYYQYHRKNNNNHFYSDRLIYSPGVTVFKTDDDLPQIMPQKEWFQVDVITCAAPYLGKRKYTNKTALKQLLVKRIKNFFEVAKLNDVSVLILGAWGCGAFKNPPQVVAEAFKEVVDDYSFSFSEIVFAIKSTVNNDPWIPCPNLMAFELEFYNGLSAEFGKERMNSGGYSSYILPDGRNINSQPEVPNYECWRYNNKYYGKQFSIFGDSISTLDGFNPRGYNVFYQGENCAKSGVNEMADTWWGKVIEFFGGELLVNNSWSGSRVTQLLENNGLFPSGCSDERASGLHINDVKPDVIIIYLGTNDWANGCSIYPSDEELFEMCTPLQTCEYFDIAYSQMLKKVKSNYPQAEIWCCTLPTSFMSSNPNFKFPHSYGGTHIEKYNNIIKGTANSLNCKVIDLYGFNKPYDTIDGTHPNKDGMSALATMMCESASGFTIEEITSGDYKEEFIRTNKGQTTLLHGEYIKLTVASTGKTVEFSKPKIIVGRHQDCDFVFDKSLTAIARIHAKFLLKDNAWYLCDKNSGNGVWINGVRIEKDKYYELNVDDEIDFAQSEKLIFFKTQTSQQNQFEQDINVLNTIIADRYRLLKEIGRGGMSTVYLAIDERINKTWAIKVIDKEKASKYRLAYILDEANMMKKLDHPGIARLVDIVDDERNLCIVMDYVEGATLQAVVDQFGAQPYEKVIDWAKQACDILGYLHSFNPPFIYRDMKPANLILQPDGKVKIIDFGIMRQYKPGATCDTANLGTKGYAAPEGYHGQTYPRSDIYGLGVTMHYLVTGIDPCKPSYEIKSIREYNPNLPKGLEYIIDKCTQLNPADRYQNCAELMADLNNYQSLPKQNNIFKKLFGK